MRLARPLFAAALAAGLLTAASAHAQPARPAPVRDYKAAPAGKYAIDPKHTGVVARIPHMGFSYSIFRFNAVAGNLVWDPADPAKDVLNVTVDTASIVTGPVEGFTAELSGPQYLKSAQFPRATFVSKAFHIIDAHHGTVDGELTVMGVVKTVTFDVELVGAGQGFRGPVMGVTARTALHPKDYGFPPFFSGDIELVIDSEFDKLPG